MSKFAEIENLKQRITEQRNFLVLEQEQLRKADYSDTLQNAKYKDEKLFRFSKILRSITTAD